MEKWNFIKDEGGCCPFSEDICIFFGYSTRGILSTVFVGARLTWFSLFLHSLFDNHRFMKAKGRVSVNKGRVSHEYL